MSRSGSARLRRGPAERIGRVIASVLIGLFSVVCALPVLIAVLSSFKTNPDIVTNPLSLPLVPYLDGYRHAFEGTAGGQPIWVFLGNSATAAAVGLLLGMSTAVLAGYQLSRGSGWGTRTSTAYFVVLLTLPPVVTLIPLFTLTGQLGIRNSAVGLGVVYAASSLPLSVVLLRSFFAGFPMEIVEAARVDGASEIRSFLSVVLPLMRGPIGTVSLLQAIGMWNELVVAVVLLSDSEKYTVPVGISLFHGQFTVDLSAQFAALTLGAAPVLIAYAVFNRQFVEGLRIGALK